MSRKPHEFFIDDRNLDLGYKDNQAALKKIKAAQEKAQRKAASAKPSGKKK